MFNRSPDFEDFSFLDTTKNVLKVILMEGLVINMNDLPLKRNEQYLTLEIFEN